MGLNGRIAHTILFVLIGLQMVLIPFSVNHLLIGLFAIITLLIARMMSIFLPIFLGLRGGISVALALSLPVSAYRELVLAGCFFVVVFSIVVQGLTLNKVIDSLL